MVPGWSSCHGGFGFEIWGWSQPCPGVTELGPSCIPCQSKLSFVTFRAMPSSVKPSSVKPSSGVRVGQGELGEVCWELLGRTGTGSSFPLMVGHSTYLTAEQARFVPQGSCPCRGFVSQLSPRPSWLNEKCWEGNCGAAFGLSCW